MRIYNAASTVTAIEAIIPVDVLTVHAFPGIEIPTLTLTPQVSGDALADRAIDDAQITENDGTLHVIVPHHPATAGTSTGDVYNIITGMITGGTQAFRVIIAELVVPLHTHADLVSTAGTITTCGVLGAVTAHTDNGDVDIDAAATATVTTKDGGVTTGHVRTVVAHTVNGNVHVGRVTERAELTSVNGNIHIAYTETDAVTASTVNGNIDIVQARGVRVVASAIRSITGRVWVR